jgi:PST family polysaccharide transporter
MLSVKITAVYLGPSGVALVGQLTNLLAFITGIAANGSNTAITRFTAEHRSEPDRVDNILASGLKLSLAVSLLLALVLFALSKVLAQQLFHDDQYVWVVGLLALCTPLIVITPLLTGFITGLKEFTVTSKITMVSAFVSFLLFVGMTVRYGIAGGLAAVILGTAMVFFVALPWGIGKRFFSIKQFSLPANATDVRRILGFFPLAIVHSITMPFVLILVREYIADNSGMAAAGHWQAVWSVSGVYLTVFMSSMSLYFMPRIAELQNPKELAREIQKTLAAVIGLVAMAALAIYLLRDFVVFLLYTPDFLPMRELFAYQLLGDVMRMAAWSLGFVLVAKDFHRCYVFFEILTPALFYFGTIILFPAFDSQAVPLAYAASYTINFLLAFFALRRLILPGRLFENRKPGKPDAIYSGSSFAHQFNVLYRKSASLFSYSPLMETIFPDKMKITALSQATFRNNNYTEQLTVGLFAMVIGSAIAILDNKLTINFFITVIPIIMMMRDYRVGVVLLAILLPLADAVFMPEIPFFVIGWLSLAAFLSFGLSRISGKQELIWLPKWVWLFYLMPVSFAALMGIPHLGEVPGYMLVTGTFNSVTPLKYIKNLLIYPLLTVVWMWLLMHAVRDSKHPERFIGILAFAAVLPAATAVVIAATSGLSLQYLASGAAESRSYLEVTGLHTNEMGIFLASAFGPLIFSAPNARSVTGRLALWSGLVIVALGLLLTFSRGAFVAACVSMLFFLIRAKGSKLIKWSILLMIIAVFIAFGSALLTRISDGWSGSASSFSRASAVTAARTDIWLSLWPEVEKHPILGGGLGSTAWSAAAHNTPDFSAHPHNLYLQILLDMGLVGLTLLLVFYWRFAKTLTKAVAEDATNQPPPLIRAYLQGAYAALLGYLLEAFSNGFYIPVPENTLLWASLGLGLAYTVKAKRVT